MFLFVESWLGHCQQKCAGQHLTRGHGLLPWKLLARKVCGDLPWRVWYARGHLECWNEVWTLNSSLNDNSEWWLSEYITILVFSGYISFAFVNSLMSWFFVVGEWWLRRSRPTLPISRRGYRVTLAPCTSTVPFQWSTTHNSSMNCSAIYIILSISVILRNSQIGRLRIQYVFTVYSVLL